MKRFLIAGLAACALTLAGCASIATDLGLSPTDPAKAMAVTEAAFDGATLAVEQAVQSGALKGATAAKAKTALDQAHAALLVARQAYAAGNATSVLAQVQAITSLVAEVETLVAKPAATSDADRAIERLEGAVRQLRATLAPTTLAPAAPNPRAA